MTSADFCKYCRKDFPILARKIHGKRLAYLDNAATTQKPQAVIDMIQDYYAQHNANVSRSIHVLADESTNIYEEARAALAEFLNTKPRNVVFTSSTTAAINLVAHGWARHTLKQGDEILLSVMEHHANLVPWQEIANATGAKIVFVGLTPTFELDMDDFAKKVSKKTKLVAITQASNVLGTVTPLKQIIAHAREHGALGVRILVDGAQGAGHIPTDLAALKPDFYACGAHKMYGPMGIGALVMSDDALKELRPVTRGGGMVDTVDEETHTIIDAPYCFEAGTPNVAGAAGWTAAIKYLCVCGLAQARLHDLALTAKAWFALSQLPGVQLLGPDPRASLERAAIISFTLEGVHPHDLAHVLDEHGVAIRAGMHCTMPLHTALGIDATNRVSFSLYNVEEDIKQLIDGIRAAQKIFGLKKDADGSVDESVDETADESVDEGVADE